MYEEDISSVSAFTGGISLSMMKELDIKPLPDESEDSSIEESYSGNETEEPVNKQELATSREKFVLFRKQQSQVTDYFNKVSDEVILHIFQFLPKQYLIKCSAVCKRWRDISYDESLWRRYDFGRRLVKSGVLETVFFRGVNVLRLAMSEIKYPIFRPAFLQKPKLSSVQYLDLSMVTITSAGLADILYVCVRLKKLSLEYCNLNDTCLKNIAQNKQLTVLNLAMCTGLTAAGLRAICIHCERLTEWNLAWTSLTRSILMSFLPFMPVSLRRLNLSGNRMSLDDEGLLKVVTRCLNLIELDISDCPKVSQISFEALVRNCSKLEHLHSSRAYNIPTDSNRLLKNLPNFKKLEIFRTLNDDALVSLREYMPHIQINQNVFSTIARPTTGIRRTSIWGLSTGE